jgi:Tol biopolymer transport system component
MRVPVDGGEPERLLDGLVTSGKRTWAAWIRQPVMSPDGSTIAFVTDLPDPTRSNVVLKLFDLETKKLRDLDLPETVPLGHQDPEWRPDGARLLYVRNARDGARGTPQLWRYTVSNGKATTATNPGYLHPSYSPDGLWIAATRTSAFGTDIVILDAANGAEVLRLTNDDRSWAPAWSPRGDAIAFLHIQGQVVDLRMVVLEGAAGGWSAGTTLNLTELSGLDSISRPDWHIPADQLPPPTPDPPASPDPAATPAGS